MSDPLVTVVGPRGRHIEVHRSTQQALPAAFPLVTSTPAKPKRNTARKASTKTAASKKAAPADVAPATPLSPAPAAEIPTVETTKEAR